MRISAAIIASSYILTSSLVSAEDLSPFQQDPKQWILPGGNYANWRYSPLKQINTENVGRLQTAWSFSTGVLGGHEGAPLVVGDIMYLTTPFPNKVFALDLNKEGEILWRWEPRQDPSTAKIMCCDTVNRGLSYADGKVFLSQSDTTLVALDAKVGRVVWSKRNGDPSKGETSTGAPHVFKDKVLVGIAGGEFGVRGHITAYDLKTGNPIWRGYSTGPDAETLIDPEKTTHLGRPVGKETSLASWEQEQWKIGGGTVWGWFSYDPELNLVYYGTGNPAPGNPRQRPGDNRWTSTIFARDLDTGAVRWVYQMTPHDEWDFDGTGEMILVDREIDGANRKTLVHFDKNGFAYVLDRVTGELLSAEKFDPSVNWASKIDLDKSSTTYGRPLVVEKFSPDKNGEDVATKGICPSSYGAKGPAPASFSPDTGQLYAPTIHMCMDYEPFHTPYEVGKPYEGVTTEVLSARSGYNGGAILAWEISGDSKARTTDERFSLSSGALTTAGGLAFYGTVEGYLKAIDLKTGKERFRYKTGSGIVGDVMSYEHLGNQYVAVMSGISGRANYFFGTPACYEPGAICELFVRHPKPQAGGLLTVFTLPD